MATFWPREFTLEFIELYRKHECLWKVKCKDYCNRQMKDKAYDQLITLVQRIDEDANRETIIKKINNIRSSFRKEMKKIKSLALSGSGASDYIPSLWYFDEISFLTDQDVPRRSKSSTGQHANDQNEPETQGETMEDTQDLDNVSLASESVRSPTPPIGPCSTPQYQTAGPSSTLQDQAVRETSKKSKRKAADHEELLTLACNTLKTTNNVDEFDSFGQHVASNIRGMSIEQQIVAQKLISDVMFEGRLGNLSRNARVDIGFNPSVGYIPQHVFQQNYASATTTTPSYTANIPECESYRSYNN